MKIIKHLSEQILEEIEGVEGYSKDALEWKYYDPELSKTYHELAKTEYQHVQKLHEQVVRKVEEARKADVKPSQKMLDAWEERHRELISKLADAKIFMDMYK